MITNPRSDTGIHDSKGFYGYFVQLLFSHKSDCDIKIYLWSRALKGVRIMVKASAMRGDLLHIEPSMIEDSAQKPLT